VDACEATRQAVLVRTLFAELADAGVRHLFVAPGSRSTPLVQAAYELAARQPPVWQMWPVLDERAAAFAALGASRAGQLSAVICTSGSAVGHLLPACIEAKESGCTVVFVAANRPARLVGLGAPQTIDQYRAMGYFARHLEVGRCPDEPRSAKVAGQIHASLFSGQPLFIDVHLDTPLALAGGDAMPVEPRDPDDAPTYDTGPMVRPGARSRVLIVAGPLPADQAREVGPVFASAGIHWQVLAEATSNLRPYLPPSAPLHFESWLRDPAARASVVPDRVVRLGEWPVSKGLQLLLEDCALAQVPCTVVWPGRHSNPLGQRGVQMKSATPASALARYARSSPSPASRPWIDTMAALDASVARRCAEVLESPAAASNEPGLLHAFLAALPAATPVQIANSMPIRHLEAFWPRGATAVLGFSRGVNGIDGTLATAWGRAIALDRPCWVVLGDAALLHDATSLSLLRRRPDLRVLCFDNGGGAIFDGLPAAQHVDPAVHRTFFTQPHGLDLVAVARAFGLTAEVLPGPKAAATLADWARTGQGPQVVVAKTDAQAARAVWGAWTGG